MEGRLAFVFSVCELVTPQSTGRSSSASPAEVPRSLGRWSVSRRVGSWSQNQSPRRSPFLKNRDQLVWTRWRAGPAKDTFPQAFFGPLKGSYLKRSERDLAESVEAAGPMEGAWRRGEDSPPSNSGFLSYWPHNLESYLIAPWFSPLVNCTAFRLNAMCKITLYKMGLVTLHLQLWKLRERMQPELLSSCSLSDTYHY